MFFHLGELSEDVFCFCVGKKAAKGKDKPKEDKLRPSDDELRIAICDILKEVDFNTVRICLPFILGMII